MRDPVDDSIIIGPFEGECELHWGWYADRCKPCKDAATRAARLEEWEKR